MIAGEFAVLVAEHQRGQELMSIIVLPAAAAAEQQRRALMK